MSQKVQQFVKKQEKSSNWQKTFNFSNKLPCFCALDNFSAKSSKKCLISWKSTRNRRFGQNFQLFEQTIMIRGFRQLLSKKWLISSKSTKNRRFGQTFPLFDADYHVSAFWWTFQQKVAKSASFREKARNMVDLTKNLHFFKQNTMFYRFGEFFSKQLQRVPHFVKKNKTSSIWPKTSTFSNKLPSSKLLVNFSAKTCKKCHIWWGSTKNCRFGQKLRNFWTNYHVSAFWRTIQQKVAKPPSFREKARNIVNFAKKLQPFEQTTIFRRCWWPFQQKVAETPSFREKAREFVDLAKNSQLFQQTTMFRRFDELFGKKCLISWESTKNRRFGKKLATFWTNYHVSAFWRAFQQNVSKTTWFREKARKIVDLAERLHYWAFWWDLSQKVAKSASFREEARKIVDLAKNLQLFEQTTMFRRFDELFDKEVKKVPHFVEKHKKSSIWPKACNFLNKLQWFGVLVNFSAKNASFREQARKIVDLAKCLQLCEQTTMFQAFGEVFGKKCLILWKSPKNRRFGQKLVFFQPKCHILSFWWTFEQNVA